MKDDMPDLFGHRGDSRVVVIMQYMNLLIKYICTVEMRRFRF